MSEDSGNGNKGKCFDTPKTVEMAKCLADYFLGFSMIHDVFLYGSIARERVGSDVDLIVTVDEETYQKFKNLVSLSDYNSNKLDRYNAMLTTLFLSKIDYRGVSDRIFELTIGMPSKDFWNGPIKEICKVLKEGPGMDIYLLPRDWKSRLEEIQSDFSNEDPNFIKNISQDAILYDPINKKFG
ncbi:MAG: nucleotidyltransferase domain-containing protein [Candidatus Moraniibacteriota bacterium]